MRISTASPNAKAKAAFCFGVEEAQFLSGAESLQSTINKSIWWQIGLASGILLAFLFIAWE